MYNGNLIIRPVVTERSMDAVSKGKFTFIVHRFARKEEIKKEIENRFKVNVTSVATRVIKGRTQRVGIRRAEVTKPAFKKATVALKPGQKIDIFETPGK